jgi:isoleucyl-tRNA synthetase
LGAGARGQTHAGLAAQYGRLVHLANWYVRLNRRRFWKSESDADKRAAHWTLYHVLQTLCRLLAPLLTFLSDALFPMA